MANEADLHPQKDDLMAFGLGKLPPEDASTIETHLEECPSCCDTMLELQDDTFLALVKKSPPRPVSDDTDVDAENSKPSSHTAFQPTVLESDDGNSSVKLSGDDAELPRELREHNRYRILERIGHGGMGDVYKAEHMVMNRPVALKVIKPELVQNESAIKRFHREVQAAARLHHGNIVTAHDAERAGSSHFLVMEFVDGVNLDQVLKERCPLRVEEACDAIRQTAQGLEHAHALGMVHRDIKPHNLMLTEAGDVKILDFGLASFASLAATEEAEPDEDSAQTQLPTEQVLHQLTQMGTMMGTPDYIAPEQAKDARKADIRADIYSLGCTFYTLLTGKPPFKGDTVAEKLTAHAQNDPEPLANFRGDVPAEVEVILQKMMAKDPAERYQTPTELVEALQQASVGRQPHESNQRADAPSSPIRRRPILAAVAGVIAALITFAVYYIQTDYGVVRIEVADESLKVELAGETITLKDGNKELTIRAGAHKLFVKQGDLEFYTNDFQLGRGEDLRFKVERRPGEVVVMKEGERFGGKRSAPQLGPGLAESSKNRIHLVFDRRDGHHIFEIPGVLTTAESDEMIRQIRTRLAENPQLVVEVDLGPAVDLDHIEAVRSLERLREQIAVLGATLKLSPKLQAHADLARARSRLKAERMKQLKQIGIAMNDFAETFQLFPPGRNPQWFGKDGRPHLSWRVHILPQIGHDDLYRQFRLNEPWDSEHNIKLLDRMPPIYKTTDDPTKTTLLAVVGEGAAYEGKAGLSRDDNKLWPDGQFNTAIVVDAGQEKAVPWTKPEDLPFDKEDPIRAFGTSDFSNQFLALMADGAVKSIPYDTAPEQLRNLFLRADGNVLDLSKKRTTPLPATDTVANFLDRMEDLFDQLRKNGGKSLTLDDDLRAALAAFNEKMKSHGPTAKWTRTTMAEVDRRLGGRLRQSAETMQAVLNALADYNAELPEMPSAEQRLVWGLIKLLTQLSQEHAEPQDAAFSSGDPAVDKILTDALAVYTFEENTFYREQGRMQVRDVSGNGHDASIEDDKRAFAAEGKVGGALACNRNVAGFAPEGLPGSGIKVRGQNMYELPMPKLRLPEPFLAGRGEYTMTVWVKDAAKGTMPSGKSLRMFYQEGFPKENAAVHPLAFSFLERQIQAMCLGELIDPSHKNAQALPAEDVLPKDEWFFLALTLVTNDDKSMLRITVNAKTIERPFAAIPEIPKGGFGLIGGIDGMIDELAFFKRALADDEIQRLRQFGLDQQPLVSGKKSTTPATADTERPKTTRTDYDRLLGKWNAKTGIIQGKAAGQWGDAQYEFLPGKKLNMIFPKPERQVVPVTVTLDENAQPKTMDLRLENGGIRKCLYELDGDELLLAMNLLDSERPKRLMNLPGDSHVLLQLRRDGLYESRIKTLVSEAAGITVDQMSVLAAPKGKQPRIEDFNSQPLTAWLFFALDAKAEEKNPKAPEDFRYLTEQRPKPLEMARALLPNPLRGYASFIQPEYITNVTLNIEGDTASGEVTFEKKGLYRGKVLFLAKHAGKTWQIEELEMPNIGIKTVRGADGKWHSDPGENANKSESQ